MRVAAFTKYDREAASTRQRVLQYRPSLAEAGIELDHYPLLGNAYVRSLATSERWSRTELIASYARRLVQLLRRSRYDLIWVYAELFPYLPAAFERLVFRSGVPVVYDCDDAFYLAYNESRNPLARALLSGKIERLIGGAAAATCGNEFLRDHAAKLCTNTIVVPTVVDTDIYRPAPRPSSGPPVIGWIGSPSTWENVRPLLPVLQQVCAVKGARFRVVGAGVRAARDKFPQMDLVPWSEATEVAEVQGFDVGIMPLLDAPFQRGKSGYKLIQYMACGVPAIGSPVGVNSSILADGCGILAGTADEWAGALTRLLEDADLRRTIGAAGRARAVKQYSLAVHEPRLIELFRRVAADQAEATAAISSRTS
jgi:glycosyltransferase involved in cell wall biosynthesis